MRKFLWACVAAFSLGFVVRVMAATVENGPGSSGGSGTVTSVSGTAPVSVATGTTTPVVSMARSSGTVNGYLATTDWTLFNAKQAALVQADGTHDGYIGTADWLTFNAKVAKAGDTMSGALVLPSNGLAVGTTELVVASSKVGIGTSSPGFKLHLHGVSAAGGIAVDSDLSGDAFSLNNAGGVRLTYSDGLTFHSYRGIYASVEATTTQTAPGFGFDNDTQTGLFRAAAGVLGFTAAGTESARLDATKLTVTGLIQMKVQGAASTPSCAAGSKGTLALTSAMLLCVCDGSGFVETADGSSACTF